jgi:uncharacterized protein YecE (DUF72 family)
VPAMGRLRIGISGWNYKPWRGKFYPAKLPHKQELAYASAIFPTIEINGTFYSQQTPASFARWAAETPEGFVFAVKAPRYLTHMLRLRNVRAPMANFFASGLLRLGAKLGPILWQLPPSFRFDPERLAAFFEILPRDTEAAAKLARKHDHKLRSRAWLAVDRRRKLRHALEIRHDSFRDPAFIALLRKHDVALVCADAVEWPLLMDATADFVYCRLHGSEELYASGYGKPALRHWAARIKAWRTGSQPRDREHVIARPPPRRRARDVYVYFDNDAKVRAPADALCLRELAGA